MSRSTLRRSGAFLASAGLLASMTAATVAAPAAAQAADTATPAADAAGAAAPTTPVYFTYTAGDPASQSAGTFDESTGELRGASQEGIPVEASDPRVSGLAYVVANGNQEIGPDGVVGVLESRSYRIVNDGGAWVGSATFVLSGDPSVDGPPTIARETGVLTGEGGYQGMTIVATGDYREGSSGEGVIYGVAVPPVPDVPDASTE